MLHFQTLLRPQWLVVLLFPFCLFLPQPANAGMITINLSTTADLNNLQVGAPVTFDVVLSGLDPGDELESLGVGVGFDGAILGTPMISLGVIIPDPSGAIISEDPGFADVLYFSFPLTGATIDSNGTFFSFTVTPVVAGSDMVEITSRDAFGLLGPVETNSAVPSLSFTVVPEPSSLLLWGVGSGLLFGAALIRRRARGGLRPQSASSDRNGPPIIENL